MLGKPLEVLSFQQGRAGLRRYLSRCGRLPLRDYVPAIEGTIVDQRNRSCCRDHMVRAEPDDDINYSVLALMLLEDIGVGFELADVARAWLRVLPAGQTWTAERAAYRTMLAMMDDEFVNGEEPGFDLLECSDNDCNEWIGGQIRADLYGWVCPGQPILAARLASRDASLSHRGEGVYGAAFIAALGAVVVVAETLDDAIDVALEQIPEDCGAATAVRYGRELAGKPEALATLQQLYEGMSPVHTLNNLALVVWALCSADGDFSQAIGDVVAAGWDTDSNGATVGGLCGIAGADIPETWTRPWQGRIGLSLAGHSEVTLDELVSRTVSVAHKLAGEHDVCTPH
jgi:ADP-ribosylglycohydrolase